VTSNQESKKMTKGIDLTRGAYEGKGHWKGRWEKKKKKKKIVADGVGQMGLKKGGRPEKRETLGSKKRRESLGSGDCRRAGFLPSSAGKKDDGQPLKALTGPRGGTGENQ